MSTTSVARTGQTLDVGHAPAGGRARPAPVEPGQDGVGIQPGKGVRLTPCPRCSRHLPSTAGPGRRLCGVCAAERRSIVRERWTARWRRQRYS